MARAPFSLTAMAHELQAVPDAYIGQELKKLLLWQLGKQQTIGYRVSWYLMKIILNWRQEAHSRKEAEARGRDGQRETVPMGSLIAQVLHDQG